MTRSVSWLINSATSPFQLPFTIPPQAPSFTRLRAKSNERSLENFLSRSTQKPEQHLNIVEFEFLISSVLLTLTVSQKHSFIGLQRLKIDLNWKFSVKMLCRINYSELILSVSLVQSQPPFDRLSL